MFSYFDEEDFKFQRIRSVVSIPFYFDEAGVGSKNSTLLGSIELEFSCEIEGKLRFLSFLASLIFYLPNKIAVVGRVSGFVPNLKSFPTSSDLFEIMTFSDLSKELNLFTLSTNGINYLSNQQVLSISS